MQKSKAKFIAKVGVLSALASAIMFIETPLPFMPPFLKLDLSEIIVLLGAFALGPLAGVAFELDINLVIGSLSMVVLALLINYFVMIPLYVEIFAKQFNITAEQSMQNIIQMSAEENQGIMDFKTLILFGVVPFNIIKVIIVSLLTFVSYKRVSPLLHR